METTMKYLMTLLATMFAILLPALPAAAFGPHVADGYRDTGCIEAANVPVRSARTGEVLYVMNSTCPIREDGTIAEADEEAEPGKPSKGKGWAKGKAFARK
jgi:hypothetical protein